MDHHCGFINNCVGARNHKSFVIFIALFGLADAMFTWAMGTCTDCACAAGSPVAAADGTHAVARGTGFSEVSRADPEAGLWSRLRHYGHEHPFVMVIACWSAFNGLSVGVLLLFQAYQLSRDITTNEYKNAYRYSYLHTKRGRVSSPWSGGFVQNLVDLCELNCFDLVQPRRIDWTSAHDVPPAAATSQPTQYDV